MSTINALKEQAQTWTPLHMIDFTWASGATLSVCTHAVTFNGTTYLPRVTAQQIDQTQALSPTGIDIPPNVKITMADSDKSMWAIEVAQKFRGARMQVTFAYCDLSTMTFSDSVIPFVGRCDRPEVNDQTLAVSASYILNLQAVSLPQYPIQLPCPKIKPLTTAQCALANTPGSLYFQCGSTNPTPCNFTKAGCAAVNNPLSFGGIVYEVPPASKSESYLTGQWLLTLVSDPCDTKYGDYAPIGYGTAWVNCLNLGTFPDANSTRGEAIVCQGLVSNIIQVVVAGEILPAATDVTGTSPYIVSDPLFRYNVISQGGRFGTLNLDTPWNGSGDPHGGLCVIEWVTYNSVTSSTPQIQALVEFPQVTAYAQIASIASGVATLPAGVVNSRIAGNSPYTVSIIGNSNPALNSTFGLTTWSYGPPGTFTLAGTTASGTGGYVAYLVDSSDYAWAIFDILIRAGAQVSDLDLNSFAAASTYFAQQVPYTTSQNKYYASNITYSNGDVVLYATDGQYYVSLSDGNINNVPNLEFVLHGAGFSGDTGWWALTTSQPTTSVTTSLHARYTCSLVVRQRRTAADIVGGMLRGCNSHLGRNLSTGQIGLVFHGTIAEQQSTLPDGSNYASLVNSGYAAYSFDETSMVRVNKLSSFQRASRSGSGIPNVVSIGFNDEDNDYAGDSCKVTNPTDIATMGQEIQGSCTTDGCNSLDRANRIGSIYLNEQEGGDVWRWITTAKAVKLLVGQIVLVTNAKHGFSLTPFRIQGIAPEDNWKRATITASLHNDSWYADSLTLTGTPQAARASLNRAPWPWCPNTAAPFSGDPLYAATEETFGIQLAYEPMTDGSQILSADIAGVMPVNNPDVTLQPPALSQQGDTAATGGFLSNGVYFVAAASTDATGLPGPISTPCQIVVAQGGSANTITAPVWFWDPAGTGWKIYAGTSSAKLTLQSSGTGAPPQAIVLTAIAGPDEGQPDIEADSITIQPKWVPHSGPWANTVTVAANAISITGAGWSTNQWQGYDCMLLWKASGVAVPVRNFHVTSNTATTLTVTPDPVAAGVVTGDLIGMLSLPTVSGLTLTDANWANTLSGLGTGLTAHAEKGRILRFIAGPGRGYRYTIADNTATSITVIGPWIVTPTSASRYIIEDTMPLPALNSGSMPNNGDPTTPLTLSVPVANYTGEVLSFEAIILDGDGNTSAPQLNPVRIVWVPGAASGLTIGTVAAAPNVTVGTIIVDPSETTNLGVVNA